MPKEYEYNFHEFNKEEIIRNIKKHGGKKFGIFLFRVECAYFNLLSAYEFNASSDGGLFLVE